MAAPWKSNAGASDDMLNRAVAALRAQEDAEKERRKTEVRALLSNAEVQAHRYAERRSREYEFYGKGRYKGKRLTNITPRHTASATVNAGSLKALRTTLPPDHEQALGGLPDRPSVAWLQKIDRNAATDLGRTETAEKKKRRVIGREEQAARAAELPAKGGYRDPSPDYDGPEK